MAVDNLVELSVFKKLPRVAEALAGFDDHDVLDAIRRRKGGPVGSRSVKGVEIEAMVAAPEGFGDDVPIDPNFHARKYPAHRRTDPFGAFVADIVQVHRLREVLALGGFTRLEAPMPDIDGEYRDDVERAEISIDPLWFPAVENRGEGVLLHFSPDAIRSWRDRPAVRRRIADLQTGYINWREQRKNPPAFPGGTYVMLHTLSHMLLQSLSARCGYPAASIRERIYVDKENQLYGVLLYTSSPDAEGTLGGLVQQARHIGDHIRQALDTAACARTIPSAHNTRRRTVSRNDGSTARPATAACWSRRPRARCGTTTWTEPWSSRRLPSARPHSSLKRGSCDRRACGAPGTSAEAAGAGP